MHVLGLPDVGNKGHNATVFVVRQGQTGFLLGLAHDAVLRTLFVLKFAADAEPFVMALVIFLFRAVQHQIIVIFLNINQRCIAHQNHLTFCLLL